jgi:probable non-F420 flavinoid oxidoreductase
VKVGYHASHEQHPPSRLLRYVRLAEEAGFDAAMCSDHIAPFTERDGHSGFAWAWLGAALEATAFPMGVVTSPGHRYHPAILAQAAATFAEMYPGRFWMALGSGEYLNEHVTATQWPSKPEREVRLEESAAIIRRLLRGETVSSCAVPTDTARLYVTPVRPPLLVGAAITPETAARVAGWADGMVTVAAPLQDLERVVREFRENGGAGKPMCLQAQHAFARSDDEARAAACERWRVSSLPSSTMTELKTAADFDRATADADDGQILRSVRASADPAEHLRWLLEYRDLGFDAVYVHNVQADDEPFIRAFGGEVLPGVRA